MLAKRFGKTLKKSILRSFYDVARTKYQRNIDQLDEKQLRDKELCRKVMKKRIHQHYGKDQDGLYHGKTHGWKNEVSFSEKKHKVFTKVNVFKKSLYSQILDKTFKIDVSAQALRNIRKYGGFDNYILLTYSKNMQSQYGEYLRKMMYAKLNNPKFDVPDMVGEERFIHKKMNKYFKERKKYFGDRSDIWVPPEIRNTDLNKARVGLYEEGFTPYKYREKMHEVMKHTVSKEDFEIKGPDVDFAREESKRQKELMKVYAKEGKENFKKILPSKKHRAQFIKANEEAMEFYESIGMDWMR